MSSSPRLVFGREGELQAEAQRKVLRTEQCSLPRHHTRRPSGLDAQGRRWLLQQPARTGIARIPACSSHAADRSPSWLILRQLLARGRAGTQSAFLQLLLHVKVCRGARRAAVRARSGTKKMHSKGFICLPTAALLRSTPYVTGTSVLGITYKDGVLLAADTLGGQHRKLPCCLQQTCLFCKLLNVLGIGGSDKRHAGRGLAGSYGSTKRYKSFERLARVNNTTVLGAGGELSDFQYIQTLLEELATEDYCADDGIQLTPREVYAYLSRVLYNRRNKHAAPASPLCLLVPCSCLATSGPCFASVATSEVLVFVTARLCYKVGLMYHSMDVFDEELNRALNAQPVRPGSTRCGTAWWWAAWRMACPSWARWA